MMQEAEENILRLVQEHKEMKDQIRDLMTIRLEKSKSQLLACMGMVATDSSTQHEIKKLLEEPEESKE
ncbi:hypothetical protein H6P81_007605 [Aristolochia fimbriata]|uniref:Uncharacterized protein n=1 Tax=Aristolochia fimbriata TaxID=158543 RepID=A0AAV7F1Z4_ARIFI|nr:hypothetical protein H6P81_007605 [Aristolochia fimbriata]